MKGYRAWKQHNPRKSSGDSSLLIPKYVMANRRFAGHGYSSPDVLEQVARGLDWETIIEEWHGSITHEAIAEAVHLAAQALLKHADAFVVASTTS